jgi:hypothetical protein
VKLGNYIFELSVSVRVYEKRDEGDCRGVLKDGMKVTNTVFTPNRLALCQKLSARRMEELIKEYAEKYGLPPDNWKEEKELWESGKWPPKPLEEEGIK